MRLGTLFLTAALVASTTFSAPAFAQGASDKQMEDLAASLGKAPITATSGNPDYTQVYMVQTSVSSELVKIQNPFWGTHDQCMKQGALDSADLQTSMSIRGVILRCFKTSP